MCDVNNIRSTNQRSFKPTFSTLALESGSDCGSKRDQSYVDIPSLLRNSQ